VQLELVLLAWGLKKRKEKLGDGLPLGLRRGRGGRGGGRARRRRHPAKWRASMVRKS